MSSKTSGNRPEPKKRPSQKDEQNERDLPSVNERLGHLRPSRELLEFYRKKILEYDNEHDEMLAKLETYRSTYQEQHQSSWELRQREDEICELQKALSNMQVYLFQEREHVLRLYAENDRLKIHELEDRKKIHHLLTLCGKSDAEVTYFLKEPPAKPVVEQRVKPRSYPADRPLSASSSMTSEPAGFARQATSTAGSRKREPGPSVKPAKRGFKLSAVEEENARLRDSNQLLLLQVQAMQAQMEDQAKLSREQSEALLEDRRVRQEENDTARQRDTDKLKQVADKLRKTQELLYQSTKDFLSLRNEHRSHERVWVAEKDELLREADGLREQLDGSADPVLDLPAEDSRERQKCQAEVESLKWQLEQSQRMGEAYRDQVLQLEDRLSRHREEGDYHRTVFKDRSDKIAKRLELMTKRYEELEKRRKLEVEGFKTDIKQLRHRLKDMERKLYKVTLGAEPSLSDLERPEDIDLVMLQSVRRTAGRSKQLMDELSGLKAKVYGLENDLRHL